MAKDKTEKENRATQKQINRKIAELKALTESPDLQPHDEQDIDKLSYVKISRDIRLRKGKWQRYSDDQERRMHEDGLD